MKEVLIDVRDLDYTWWERVEAYLDGGKLHLPRRSVERLGEIDPETGDALLISGFVEAKHGTLDGEDVWTVGAGDMPVRMSRVGRGR